MKYAEDAKNWLGAHGVVMGNAEHKHLINFAPFTLLPSLFPRYLYEEAMLVQNDFQMLYHLASLDHSFIEDALKSVIIHDEFTRRLYEIYNKVRKEGYKPKFYFNITRSDYMIDQVKESRLESPYEMKQIEMNMIAASLGGLGTNVGNLHRFMGSIMGTKCPYRKENLTSCNTIGELGAGLAKAWQYYNVEDSVVVFIVREVEPNRFDQHMLEYSFYDNIRKLGYERHVPVLFCTLQQVYDNGCLSCDNRFLLEGKEVALFYFRAGFAPEDFSEETWKVRHLVEKSVAVKCPTVAGQLVGTKKVQQIFSAPGMVENFIKNAESVKRIRKTFAGLFTLDPGPEGDGAAQMALSDPSKYVLKPQREGGGNNMYDNEMVDELNRLKDPAERSQYIVMERVQPPTVKNYIVHVDFEKPLSADTVSELGIFGVFLCDDEHELVNKSAGCILRTKSIEHNDGGIAAGRAVLDTPCLI